MTKLFAFLFSVCLIVCADAHAADPVRTRVAMANHYRGPDYDFVRNMFFEMMGDQMDLDGSYRPGLGRDIFHKMFVQFFPNWIDAKLPLEQNVEDYVDDAINVGYFDLNDDGVDELFVTFETSLACGTVGCSAWIFAKRNDAWTQIADWTIDGAGFVSDERISGYRTLFHVSEYGVRWDAQHGRYGDLCIDRARGAGNPDDKNLEDCRF